jgi:DNA helicase-2/ATP-dependent DNA helicase PcrA
MDSSPDTTLTPPQTQAVTHLDGPLLVLAGPGSGKTTVVTRRVAHLIDQGIPPWQILALTFTNKAAGEMRERIERRLPEDLPGRRGLTIATFHAFCARLLRTYGAEAGVPERFSIYDTADQRDAVKQALRAADLSERNFSPAAVLSAISGAKNRLLDAAGYAGEAHDFYTRTISRAYTEYEKVLNANGGLDFDDLLLVSARLLRGNEIVRRELQDRFQYLLVDEYQDTNHAQFVIAGALASEHRNICVVGDPDQSIYGWRGADIRNILEFEQQYPEATVIPLGQNFRSTGHIVAVADHLIRNNRRRKHKPLHTELEDGDKPLVMRCLDEHHEAALVVQELRGRHVDDGIAWKDMAILYRMNALSRVLEEAFRDAQVPYVIARGTAFYERKEIKDALAYLRAIANPNDEVALRRIINTPARGIGKTTLDRIEMFALDRGMRLFEALAAASSVDTLSARAKKSVGAFVELVRGWRARLDDPAPASADALADLVEHVVRTSGMETLYRQSRAEEDQERLENLEELISAAADFEPVIEPIAGEAEEPASWSLAGRLGAYLESVALVSDADAIDPTNGAVTLMTLHAAKGLEFDTVAMVGLEDGLLPHHRAAESDEALEEERRLCFVGMTRAKRRLLVSRAQVRTHRGMRERAIESRFIGELPPEDVRHLDVGGDDYAGFDPYEGSTLAGRQRARRGALANLPAGALVRHPTFGVGRVDAVVPRSGGASARVTFQSVGTKTLILEYAKLELVE